MKSGPPQGLGDIEYIGSATTYQDSLLVNDASAQTFFSIPAVWM